MILVGAMGKWRNTAKLSIGRCGYGVLCAVLMFSILGEAHGQEQKDRTAPLPAMDTPSSDHQHPQYKIDIPDLKGNEGNAAKPDSPTERNDSSNALGGGDEASDSTADQNDDVNKGPMDQPYPYVVINQNVRDAVREMSTNLGVPLDLSSKVKGRISGNVKANTVRDFLNSISRSNGLTWFFDDVLHVYSQDESTTASFALSPRQAIAVEAELVGANGWGQEVRRAANGRQLRVTGSPAWVGTTRALIDAFAPVRASGKSRVIRGNMGDSGSGSNR